MILLLFIHLFVLLAFSLHFSSSSAFRRTLFTHSAHLNSCELLRCRIKQPPWLYLVFHSDYASIPFHPAIKRVWLYRLWLDVFVGGWSPSPLSAGVPCCRLIVSVIYITVVAVVLVDIISSPEHIYNLVSGGGVVAIIVIFFIFSHDASKVRLTQL